MKVFALTIFAGAFLLFQVQPLIAKFILPWFGGSPAVWTTCLLFFQSLLLAGYAYAHGTVRYLSSRGQAGLHLVLLLAALALLPIVPGAHWKPGPADDPTWRILLLLTVCLGMPYFVLASTGPLLQAWSSRLEPAAAPYRLYALSNIASLLALMSYPFLLEPLLTRRTQASLWTWSFGAFVLLSGISAWRVWRSHPLPINFGPERTANDALTPAFSPSAAAAQQCGESDGEKMPEARPRTAPLDRSSRREEALTAFAPERMSLLTSAATSFVGMEQPSGVERAPTAYARSLWFLLPLCGSVLLLATTNKLCQDVAVIPLLWVLPLGLYLLTFILCFDRPVWYARTAFTLLLVPLLALLCDALFKESEVSLSRQITVYGGTLFAGCMVCHGELYRRRPLPRYLTSFYLLLAAGGAVGGLFVAVVAPMVFRSYAELNWAVGLLAALVLGIHAFEKSSWMIGGRRWRLWPFLLVGVLALGVTLLVQTQVAARGTVIMSRNFYGVLRVFDVKPEDRVYHAYLLKHGDTTHGQQFVEPLKARMPTTYYGERSGVGLAMDFFSARTNRHVGMVGLGTGTLAAYGRPGDTFRFYEINPAIRRLAETGFTYLKESDAKVEVVMGDARLTLENEPSQQFDLLVLDAFSSDAIPVHLLTREAFALYLRHLKPDGAIAVHISNRHLDLYPVTQGLAAHFHLGSIFVLCVEAESTWWFKSSQWVLLSRNSEFLGAQRILAGASQPPSGATNAVLWTDDYSSVFPLFKH